MAQPMPAGSSPCRPRFATQRNPDRRTLGHVVGQTAAALGQPLLWWQQAIADVAWELDDDGQLWYDEVDLTVPRQQGKTALTRAKTIARCVPFTGYLSRLLGMPMPQAALYTAQTRNKARDRWEREFVGAVKRSPNFREVRAGKTKRPNDFSVRRANGSEELRFGTDSWVGVTAPAKGAGAQQASGHGDTLDDGTIDEALVHEDDTQEQAMSPTMATRPSAQLWVVSTAGFQFSAYLYRKVVAGRRSIERGDTDSRIAYFEFSADEDEDPTDPATWQRCMPSLGTLVPERFIAGRLEAAMRGESVGGDDDDGMVGLDGFRRAYLNQWPDVPILDRLGDRPVTLAQWWQCLDEQSTRVRGEPLVLGVDVSPRRWGAISACGTRSDGWAHAEVITHRPGTDWIAAEVARLVDTHRPLAVWIDGTAPIGDLVERLKQAKLVLHADDDKRGIVHIATSGEVARACQSFVDMVTTQQLRHIGEPAVTTAIDGARRQQHGDSWRFTRAGSASDISPLMADVLATWGYRKFRPIMRAPSTAHVDTSQVAYDPFSRRQERLRI